MPPEQEEDRASQDGRPTDAGEQDHLRLCRAALGVACQDLVGPGTLVPADIGRRRPRLDAVLRPEPERDGAGRRDREPTPAFDARSRLEALRPRLDGAAVTGELVG